MRQLQQVFAITSYDSYEDPQDYFSQTQTAPAGAKGDMSQISEE